MTFVTIVPWAREIQNKFEASLYIGTEIRFARVRDFGDKTLLHATLLGSLRTGRKPSPNLPVFVAQRADRLGSVPTASAFAPCFPVDSAEFCRFAIRFAITNGQNSCYIAPHIRSRSRI